MSSPPAPCATDLNLVKEPGGACPECGHRIIAHDLEQVCAACWVLAEGGILPTRPKVGSSPSSVNPAGGISTR